MVCQPELSWVNKKKTNTNFPFRYYPKDNFPEWKSALTEPLGTQEHMHLRNGIKYKPAKHDVYFNFYFKINVFTVTQKSTSEVK